MQSSILIDTSGDNETRILVLEGQEIQEYKQEDTNSNRLAGNIYLARIDKIEPSIQAAFVDLGTGRHGFLPFRAIHPDYFNLEEVRNGEKSSKEDPKSNYINSFAEIIKEDFSDYTDGLSDLGISLSKQSNEAKFDPNGSTNFNGKISEKNNQPKPSDYLIQNVLKKDQVVLVQVSRDEFHAKGPAVTTYISLPSKYCVYFPNSNKGFSISNKIHSHEVREYLKKFIENSELNEGEGLILRTINAIPTEGSIENDFQRLKKKWRLIQTNSHDSKAPTLLQKEGDLIERTLRDYFRDGLNEIIVHGKRGYERCKEIIESIAPDEINIVQEHIGPRPLFVQWGLYEEIRMLHHPIVQLKSGGHLVIETTEALVSIDINSAKSNQGNSLSETALRTNLEAAEEIARQLRLRDLAGIIVIDFIDMESWSHRKEVQDTFRNALKKDQAWINTSPISRIGLLEMTRQRTGEDLVGHTTTRCSSCDGTGRVLLDETVAINILRHVEAECSFRKAGNVIITVSNQISQFLLNEQRRDVSTIEDNFGCRIRFEIESSWNSRDYAFKIFNADKEKLAFKFETRSQSGNSMSNSQVSRKRKPRKQTNINTKSNDSQVRGENTSTKRFSRRSNENQTSAHIPNGRNLIPEGNGIGQHELNDDQQLSKRSTPDGSNQINSRNDDGEITAASRTSASASKKKPTSRRVSRRREKKVRQKNFNAVNQNSSVSDLKTGSLTETNIEMKDKTDGSKSTKNSKKVKSVSSHDQNQKRKKTSTIEAEDQLVEYNNKILAKDTSIADKSKDEVSANNITQQSAPQQNNNSKDLSQVLDKIAPSNGHEIDHGYFNDR